MKIKELVHQEHPEDTEYEVIVSTHGSIERDLIKIHLAQAQEKYKT